MAKTTSTTVTSGFNSSTVLNTNFTRLDAELNDKVLYRNNPAGEPNQMENDIDLNSNDLLNVNQVDTTSLKIGGTLVTTTAMTLNDASEIAYDQGDTGSVATTVEVKLQESVSLKDFGAVGDGVTDDTTKIQSALDSGNSSVAATTTNGSYLYSAKLTIPSDTVVDGQGSTISSTYSGTQVDLSGSSNVKVKDLKSLVRSSPTYLNDTNTVNVSYEGLHVEENGGTPGQVMALSDSNFTRISDSFFKEVGYSVIQQTGKAPNNVLVNGNFCYNSLKDFYNQNNDTDSGVVFGHVVSNNLIDTTASTQSYPATESRGIGFTSIYGGVAALNSMTGIKGDAGTHLENVQETAIIGNYYRNCLKDILFSGTPGSTRRIVQLEGVTGGTVSVGDEIVGSSSGATGDVHFNLGDGGYFQVINIAGGPFTAGETFTITAGSATGTIFDIDPVQVHSTVMGNIMHITDSNGPVGVSAGVNNFNLRTAFIGNTYNSQADRSPTTKGMSIESSKATYHLGETYRGWTRAVASDTGAIDHHFQQCAFWFNTSNFNNQLFDSSVTECHFYDGETGFADLRNSEIRSCNFHAGSINVLSTTNDNLWINNKVDASVTLTSLSVLDFRQWKSEFFDKDCRTNTIRRTSIAPSSGTPVVLATLTPRAPETSVSIQSQISFRNSAANRYGAGFERMQIVWNASTVPTITNDAADFNPDGGVTIVAVDVGSGVTEIRALGATASGWLADVDVTIVESGVNVVPDVFVDTL